jgi:hypothetical protein
LRSALEGAGVRYAVGGSWASTAFGEPRFTNDVDVVADFADWFKAGGEISEVQWRDIGGIVRACGASLDRRYLKQSAAKLGVAALLERALNQV